MNANTDAVTGYLTAFYTGDFETAAGFIADEFSFRGPFLSVDGKHPFLAGAEGLRSIVRGHRLLRRWDDGADISSLYEVDLETPNARGTVVMSEWHRVAEGRLVAGHVVFDTAAFRSIVGSPAGE